MARGDNEPNKRIPLQPPIEDVPAPPVGQLDDGQLEAKQLSRGLPRRDLKLEADEADHDRSQKFKNHFEKMAVVTVWILFFGFMGVGGVWFFHLVAPAYGWLKPDQLDKLQGLLTGGVIAGLVADHVKKRMG